MKINVNEIKVGMLLEYKNDLWQVLKTQHVKPGKGGAFNQVEMKSINNGTKINERFRSSENIEKASVEEIKFLFIYKENNNFVFMNTKTYEQINLGKDIIRYKEEMLSENLEVTISFYEDKPIFIELPKQIISKVKDTETAIKGQTASSSYKPAILENGIKIQVPPFVEIGDEITFDSRNLEYIKKN
tara:strand:- start:1857 stop:2417 length:561 start_codon:yes stop_codon:yes gene_type:complete